MCLMISLKERTLQALDAGFTPADLAAAAERSESAVSQWKNGSIKTLSAQSAEGLAAKTGWNVKWWARGLGPRENTQSQAQSASLEIPTVEHSGPSELAWRRLEMLEKNEVPAVFRTQVPDGAMGKDLPQGRWIVCERAESDLFDVSLDGEVVVVRVNDESAYLRRMKRVDDGWIAAPDDADFKAFRSWEVKLQLLAIARHAETPLAKR